MAKARIKVQNLPDAPKPTKATRAVDPREAERQQRISEHRELHLRIDQGKVLCFWDKARQAKLKRLWEEGYTVKFIAREIGCSPQVCKNRLDYECKNGRIKRRSKMATEEQRKTIVARYLAKETITTIAKEMRMSRNTITKILTEEGVKK